MPVGGSSRKLEGNSVAGRYRSGQPERAWRAHYPLLWLKYCGGAVEKQPTLWCSGCILACQLSGRGSIPRGVTMFSVSVTLVPVTTMVRTWVVVLEQMRFC